MSVGPPDGSPELTLDCTGQRCPLPIIRLAQAIQSVPQGGVVRLLADDPAALADVPAWCRMRDQELLGVERPEAGPATFDVRRR